MQTLTSRLNIPDCMVLWQNDNWSIEMLPGNKEIAITDNWLVSYAYYHRTRNVLVWSDFAVNAPKYVLGKALALAKKANMISIYCD